MVVSQGTLCMASSAISPTHSVCDLILCKDRDKGGSFCSEYRTTFYLELKTVDSRVAK